MLNREPMWLKCGPEPPEPPEPPEVSVLNREPMWLKCSTIWKQRVMTPSFSAQP